MFLKLWQVFGERLALIARRKACNFSRAVLSLDEFLQGRGEGRVRNAVFGDYGGDVTRRGYVEGDVRGPDVWRGADASGVRHFRWGALFDGDLVPGGER